MNKRVILIVTFFAASLATCKHEIPQPIAEDPTNPNINDGPFDPPPTPTDCDEDTVYFQQDILPFFTARCGFDGCHSSASNEDGVTLDNYNDIIEDLDIETDDPYDNEFIEVVTDSDLDDRMPPFPDYPGLSQDQINMVITWIIQGGKNNSCEGCISENVTYQNTIGLLIQNRCQGCHSGNNPDGGILLTNYQNIKNQAQSGLLLDAITHNGNAANMPYNSAQLPQCEIDQITSWINAGAPLN